MTKIVTVTTSGKGKYEDSKSESKGICKEKTCICRE